MTLVPPGSAPGQALASRGAAAQKYSAPFPYSISFDRHLNVAFRGGGRAVWK